MTPQEFEANHIGEFNSYYEVMEAYTKHKCYEQAEAMYTSEEVKEVLIRYKSDVITNHQAQITNLNPYQWFKQFIKDEENQGRFIGYTKDDMFMWAGYCAGRRMMNPTEDVTNIFEDWERKHKELSDV